MRLKTAIAILNKRPVPLRTKEDQDYLEAIKLGIKALERIQGLRSGYNWIAMPLLNGETEE